MSEWCQNKSCPQKKIEEEDKKKFFEQLVKDRSNND